VKRADLVFVRSEPSRKFDCNETSTWPPQSQQLIKSRMLSPGGANAIVWVQENEVSSLKSRDHRVDPLSAFHAGNCSGVKLRTVGPNGKLLKAGNASGGQCAELRVKWLVEE
jgi:hypothetical protein